MLSPRRGAQPAFAVRASLIPKISGSSSRARANRSNLRILLTPCCSAKERRASPWANVADVVEAPEPSIGGAEIQGGPRVILNVAEQYGADTVEVTKNLE